MSETILVIRHLSKTDAQAIVDAIQALEENGACVFACTYSFDNTEQIVKEFTP